MSLLAGTIPNLVGGISQQPPALRLTTACEDMTNAWPSIVNGLQKRPPTEHVASLGSAFSSGATGYMIERNDDYRYLAVVENGDVRVLNLNTGVFETVSFPDGKSYLTASSPVDSFRFVTFGDYTFIANRNVTVTTSAVAEPVAGATRNDPTDEATVYVTVAAYNTYYSVFVNNTLVASVLTPHGGSGANAIEDTSQIATELYNLLTSTSTIGTPTAYDTTPTFLASGHGAAIYSSGPGYTVTQTGSTLTIEDLGAANTIAVQGGSGDKNMKVFKRSVQSFSDLPPTSPEGRIVRVAGDLEQLGDDYYVVYKDGLWVETLDWDQGEQIDVSTMPHVLINNGGGSWTFQEHNWDGRTVGDTESSINPSFAGLTINDIFVYSNRLGMLSDENVVLSEADNFENFYRTTVAQVLDSDPIDIAVLHNNVDILYHAIPYNRDLLLMSQKNQFRLTYQNYLGPTTVSIQYRTAFNVNTRVKPINVGNSVYFVDDRDDKPFAALYEYFPTDNATQDDAENVSAAVPELIPNNIQFTTASNSSDVLAIYSTNDPTSLYFYKFFWAGNKKVQSSWTKWSFPDALNLHWAGFSGSDLYVVVERSYGEYLEKVKIEDDVFDNSTNYTLLIDRYAQLSGGAATYDSVNDITTITLPYSTDATVEVISNDPLNNIYGIRHVVTRINASEVSIPGDYSSYTNYVGIAYEKSFEFSTIYAKQTQGEGQVAILDGRLQLRYLTLEHHDSAYFTTEVITPGRDVATSTYVGTILGSSASTLGSVQFSSGRFRVPVMAENLKARILIKNDSPFPSAFGSAEWSGIMSPKAVRRI